MVLLIARLKSLHENMRLTVTPRLALFLVILLCLASALIDLTSILNKSITYDEGSHLKAGLSIWRGRLEKGGESSMPISFLNAAPLIVMQSGNKGTFSATALELWLSRSVTSLFSILLGLLIYHWARALYGSLGGIIALTLFVFCPNIRAHSRLITTDLYASLSSTMALYFAWNWSRQATAISAAANGFSLGLALVSKYVNLILLPLLPVLVTAKKFGANAWSLRNFFAGSIIVFLTCLLCINMAYLFDNIFVPISSLRSESLFFRELAERLPQRFIIPLPADYLGGLDSLLRSNDTNRSFGSVYLLGQIKTPGEPPFTAYYLVALLYKIPLATQIIY